MLPGADAAAGARDVAEDGIMGSVARVAGPLTGSGGSGRRLSISFSNGTDGVGGVTGTGPVVLMPGVLVAFLSLFGARNLSG